MKKSMLKQMLPLVSLLVSSAMITACEKGGPRTPEGQTARYRCQRGYDSKVENEKMLAALVGTRAESENSIRTYIKKFEVENASSASLINPTSAAIISVQKSDMFSVSADSDAIIVTKNCEAEGGPTATVEGRGFKIENMKIKEIKLQSIELVKNDISSLQEIKVKIEKTALLDKKLKDFEAEMEKPENKKRKHLMKKDLKSDKERQIANGNILTTVSIEITGAAKQSYVIEQHSGEIFAESRIDFDKSVLKMIADRTNTVGTPDFIKEAIRANESKSYVEFTLSGGSSNVDAVEGIGQLDKLTGGRINDEQAKLQFEQAKSIDEELVITELREKLDVAAGLVKVSPEEKTDAAQATTSQTQAKADSQAVKNPAAVAAQTQAKVDDKKPVIKEEKAKANPTPAAKANPVAPAKASLPKVTKV